MGCGNGAFLLMMRDLGMRVYGVEPSYDGYAEAVRRGLDVRNCTLEEADFPDESFDVIVLNHVLEHMPHPRATLTEVKRILKPDGVAVINVPIADSFGYRTFKRLWIGLDPPRHLYVFSRKTISKYAEQVGLKIAKTRYYSSALSFIAYLNEVINRLSDRSTGFEHRKLNAPPLHLILLPLVMMIDFFKLGDSMETLLTRATLGTDRQKAASYS